MDSSALEKLEAILVTYIMDTNVVGNHKHFFESADQLLPHAPEAVDFLFCYAATLRSNVDRNSPYPIQINMNEVQAIIETPSPEL